jgi:hypothetical protein
VAELVAFLHEGPRFARVAGVEIEQVAIEGHEQFTIRGEAPGSRRPKARGDSSPFRPPGNQRGDLRGGSHGHRHRATPATPISFTAGGEAPP